MFNIFDEIIKEVSTTDKVKECARPVIEDSIWILKAK
jgi:hypothetical protein